MIKPASHSKTQLEQFRTKTERHKIHPLEMALLSVITGELVLLPWALGGMRAWAQEIALALSLLAFVLSLWPRVYSESDSARLPFRLYTWPKLLRFPIFWLGLIFLGYITVGALNPAWTFQLGENGRSWWMVATPHASWLPAGVSVPFERWGPWRMLMIYAAVWMTICALWVGFTRRRSFQTFFTVLGGNAFLLAGLGIAERALQTGKIFFVLDPPASYFVSSFPYKNHAGAYFNLLLALCAGLAFWHYERSQRRWDPLESTCRHASLSIL